MQKNGGEFKFGCEDRSNKRWAAVACFLMAVALLTFASGVASRAEPVVSGAMEVLDGDTVRYRGDVIRLVGFDAPESRPRAKCNSEAELAARATSKLRQLVAAGGIDLKLIACSCRPGTEGTQACNYGRRCGILTSAEKDVSAILIADGLAHPYICGPRSCPRRESWCR